MKLEFIVNEYLLMWHLLYQSSVAEDLHKLKQQLWLANKKEYSILYKEKELILKEKEDYIPCDDLIFNSLEESEIYKKIKKETIRYKQIILQIWDENSKLYLNALQDILKTSIMENYKIYVIYPTLNVIEVEALDKVISIGKKITIRDKDNFLTYLIYKIIESEFSVLKHQELDIAEVVLELAITNELYTRVTNESKYAIGKSNLKKMKKQIYPYWLMYLGVKEEEMEHYMVRDNIFFNISEFHYEKNLQNLDIYTFINYLIKKRRPILRKKPITAQQIEIL